MGYKLGLCGGPRGTHEAGICLVKDGEVVLAIQEERVNRFKNAVSCFPTQSITQLFKRFNLKPSDITEIAVPGESYQDMLIRWPAYLRLNFGLDIKKIKQVNHQVAHANAGFLSSNFDEALIITLDGVGDQLSGIVCSMNRLSTEPQIIKKFERPLETSIGFFWDAITQVIGFESLEEAYKTMGLAAYGNPTIDFSDFLSIKGGVPSLNSSFIQNQWKFIPYHPSEQRYSDEFVGFYKFVPRRKQDSLSNIHADIAASAQKHLVGSVAELISYYIEKNKCKNIILSGGVALNSSMMGKLKDEFSSYNLFVPQMPSDGCLAFGSVASLLEKDEWLNFKYPGPYTGFEYSNNEIIKAISQTGIQPIQYDEDIIVDYLSKEMVVGFYEGRSEFGPRALGSRSILASPINPNMKDIVNRKIKFREEFRPFAPVIREVDADNYFEVPKNANYEYMNFVVKATDMARKNAPAIVHQDGTSRVQVLKSGVNSKLEALLGRWANFSGCHVLLNTSFNLKGEPIVETPTDAIRTFFSCGLDVLVIGNYMIKK
ncbi:carbamoyltransferase C-terminal domain-containing protein [Polynucleobacter sp. MWH-UH23A]|uniref:carbamoyltransferase C-terminal domain-containing protein n=1 Tax=Polynucleobacter sp. MWH-UH23A TaxID=1855613 RepID=UPI003364CEDC